MNILASHRHQLERAIKKTGFRLADFHINPKGPIVTTQVRDAVFTFEVSGDDDFTVLATPGGQHTQERNETNGWESASNQWNQIPSVLDLFDTWLESVKRERALMRDDSAAEIAPSWVIESSPELQAKLADIERLKRQMAAIEARRGLLWRTGDALEQTVREAFTAMGFQAALTPPGTTYDVLVKLPDRRLLLEVTGIEGPLNKGRGGKLAQITDTALNHLEGQDRVVAVVNAYRKTPVAARTGAIVSADALRVIESLDGLVISTTTIYKLWELSLTQPEAARGAIMELGTHPRGVWPVSGS